MSCLVCTDQDKLPHLMREHIMQNAAFTQEVFNLTNQYRTSQGLAALSLDLDLQEAAQQHSQNMAVGDFFNHVGQDGSTVQSRALNAGYESGWVGENIAAGYTTAAEVVNGWINSPSHRANLLDPNFNELGIGYYFLSEDPGSVTAHSYWTQVFGKGEIEQPITPIFDPLQYGASYPDLIEAFGTHSAALWEHYNTCGKLEGRQPDTFSELDYLASYDDLIQAFGCNLEGATQHYIQFGYYEGRSPDTFNEIQYLASYPDLIQTLGYNPEAALRHYISYGATEGRSANGFNPAAYLNQNADLQAAFGNDLAAATRHYIEYGYSEGRTWM